MCLMYMRVYIYICIYIIYIMHAAFETFALKCCALGLLECIGLFYESATEISRKLDTHSY